MPFKRGIITLIRRPGSYFVYGCSCAWLSGKCGDLHQGRNKFQAQLIYLGLSLLF